MPELGSREESAGLAVPLRVENPLTERDEGEAIDDKDTANKRQTAMTAIEIEGRSRRSWRRRRARTARRPETARKQPQERAVRRSTGGWLFAQGSVTRPTVTMAPARASHQAFARKASGVLIQKVPGSISPVYGATGLAVTARHGRREPAGPRIPYDRAEEEHE